MGAYNYSYGSVAKLFKNPAEVAGPVCQKLRESEAGLTPHTLVEASRAETAPLHNEFEWDDAIAGEKYRETQASCIIRHLTIVETNTEEVRMNGVRAFVSTGEQTNAYVPVKEALENTTWRENLLKAAKADMKSFVYKYRKLSELAGVINKMTDFLDEEAS